MTIAFLSVSAQNPYIVKTDNVKAVANGLTLASADSLQQAEEEAPDFIGQNFKFHSLCDWKPDSMKFMVLPEKYDLVVKTFTDAKEHKEVSSMTLKYKIMVYKGHHVSNDGHTRIDFHCVDNGKDYYYEIPNGTFEDYCYTKTGVPTLAYLGDVDIAREKLMGKTLYTKVKNYRIDTNYDGEGYQEVVIEEKIPVTVKKVGVGSRSYPVKIIVEDKDGNQFFQNVAMSKTNSGMRDDEFVNDKEKFLFSGSFELVDDVMGINRHNYKSFIDRVIHTKYATQMLNETTKKVQAISPMMEYQIISITPHKNDDKSTIKLKNTILGSFFYIDMYIDSYQDPEPDKRDFFGTVFAPGPGKQIKTTEDSRTMIRLGHVGVGFSEDEVRMAAGDPNQIETGQNGIYTWVFNRSNNKLLYVEFNGSAVVSRTYTKDGPQAKKAPAKRRSNSLRTTKKTSNWQNGKGSPL